MNRVSTTSASRIGAAASDGLAAQRHSSLRTRRRVNRVSRCRQRISLERLEDRTVLATVVWDGGPTGQGASWLDPGNWVGDVLPGPNDDAVIGPAAPGQSGEVTLMGGAAVRSGTVNGSTLRLLNATFTGSLVNRGTVLALGTDTISGALTTGAGSTIRVLSDETYKGADLVVPSFANNGRIELISNSSSYASWLRVGPPGTPTGSLTNTSGGMISASTNSNVTSIASIRGGAFVNQGTVSVGPFASLFVATSDPSSNSGTLDIAPRGTFAFSGLDPSAVQEPQFVNGGAIRVGSGGLGLSGLFSCQNYRHQSGSLTGAGQVSLDGATFETDYTVAVSGGFGLNQAFVGHPRDVNGPGTVTNPTGYGLNIYRTINAPLVNRGTLAVNSAKVNGLLVNSGTITVAFDSTWNTSGDSANSGTIDVSGGNLTLNQPPGATFVTTGTITVADGRTFAVNGGTYSLSAGTTRLDLLGTLAVAGNLAQPGGVLAVAVTGSLSGGPGRNSVITVTGAVALGGSLVVVPGVVELPPTATLRIIDHGGSNPVTGYFAGLPEGAPLMLPTQRLKVSYAAGTGNDVVLTVDPTTTCVWDGGPTGRGTDWFDRFNWAGDFLPTFGDDVVIGPLAGGPTVVTMGGSAYVRSVTVTGATLRLVGATLTTQGDVNNSGIIELTSTGGANDMLMAVGSITNAAGGVITTLAGAGGGRTVSSRIDNRGTITVAADTTWNNTGASTNSGKIEVTGGNLTLIHSPASGMFDTTGAVNVAAGRTLTVSGGAFALSAGTTTVAGTLAISGTFAQAGGSLVVPLNGTTAGTQFGQLRVTGGVALGGPLVVNVGYVVPLGDTFRVIDNLGSGAVAGTFVGLPEGTVLTVNGQDFLVGYRGGSGNDVTLTRSGPIIPKVESVRVNDGSAQRSRVTSLRITFNTIVTFAAPPPDAFTLTRDGAGSAVAFFATTDSVDGATVVTLGSFTGPTAEDGSLADGSYTLSVQAARVSTVAGPLDGNGDGTPGDDYTFGAAQGLVRLYGDATGDRAVDAADLGFFRQSFGRRVGDPLYLGWLDVNTDGAVNGLDLARFRQAYTDHPPRVAAVQVNDGSVQRSRITSLSVTFNTLVTFAGAPAAAFAVTREDGAPVTFVATVSVHGDATRVTLDRFAGPAVEAGSLSEGRYTLKVLANQVSTPDGPLDGNGDGTPGDDYLFGAAQGFDRKFGDGNGDGAVNGSDLALFRQTFGRVAGDPLYQGGFDVNGDGAVNGLDLVRFRQAYGGGG